MYIYIYICESHDLWDFPVIESQVFSLRPENVTAIINERLTVAMALFRTRTTRFDDVEIRDCLADARPGRSDFRSGDGGEHLDDCPEHRTGGVATGSTW